MNRAPGIVEARFELIDYPRGVAIDPRNGDFGWPRRSTFIQPLIERISAEGLHRFPAVELRTGHEVTGFTQNPDGVTVSVTSLEKGEHTLRCAYLVGSDGGRSPTRGARVPTSRTRPAKRSNSPTSQPDASQRRDC